MSEYELATLALREHAFWAIVAQTAASLLIGIGQIFVVAWGIKAMKDSGKQRAKEHDQRHEETMTALRALIARNAPAPVSIESGT